MNGIVEQALDACDRGELDQAGQILRNHLRDHEDDKRGWELLGRIHLDQGAVAEAVAAIETASLLAPLQPESRIFLAIGYGQLGRYELSRDLLVGMIPDPTLSITLLLQVAAGLDAIGQPELAVQACRSAVRREPDQAQAYYDLGYYSARSGAPLHVVEALARQAISLEPDNVRYRVGLASMFVQQGRLTDAYDCVSRLRDDQIQQIACRCCLQRIVELFRTAGDERRATLCQSHLRDLELRGIAGDCD